MPTIILSLFTFLFLPSSSVSLSYLILAVPMSECLVKHSCMSSAFPVATLDGTGSLRCENSETFWSRRPVKLNSKQPNSFHVSRIFLLLLTLYLKSTCLLLEFYFCWNEITYRINFICHPRLKKLATLLIATWIVLVATLCKITLTLDN